MACFASQNVSAILLAAGLSNRMGENNDKLLLDYHGKTLLERAVELLDSIPFYEKICVITSYRLTQIDLPLGIKTIINSHPEIGQSESLRLSLSAATGGWYLFLSADQPRLSPYNLRQLLELADNGAGKIIFPSINGNPCTPALFSACFRNDLLCQTGDTGGRAVRKACPEACFTLKAETPMDYMDIDCEEDYKLLLQNAPPI